jgi:hypothetical protein
MMRLWIGFIAHLPLEDTTVLFDRGHAIAKRGTVPASLLADLAELFRSNGIQAACIHARRQSHGCSLTMYGVPCSLQQRVRNIWAANWR